MKETYEEYENAILRINASGIYKHRVYKTQQLLVEETHTRTHTGRPIYAFAVVVVVAEQWNIFTHFQHTFVYASLKTLYRM